MGAHDHDLFTGTERFFRPGYAANLTSSWIPSLDGVEAVLVTDEAIQNSTELATVAVAAPLETSPQMIMWDPALHPDVRTIADLGAWPYPKRQLVPMTEVVHDARRCGTGE